VKPYGTEPNTPQRRRSTSHLVAPTKIDDDGRIPVNDKTKKTVKKRARQALKKDAWNAAIEFYGAEYMFWFAVMALTRPSDWVGGA
jgi:hypothetical protein